MNSYSNVRAYLGVTLGLFVAISLASAALGSEAPVRQTSTSAKAVYSPIPGGVYTIDPAHSSIGFSIRHLMLSVVTGRFDDFSGSIRIDGDDVTKSSVEFTAKVASIDTDVPKRDEHLRSADFFEVEKYPEMTFRSTRVERAGDGYVAHGKLTLKGVTKEIAIPFTLFGAIQDPWGGTRIGVDASTTLDRQDYGITWNAQLEGGGVSVGNEVDVHLAVEAVKQEPKAKAN